jgi:hypothetical protein
MLPLDEAETRLKDAAAAAGAATVHLGHSREGRPLELVRFGSGPKRTLWYGGPHANEAVGVSTVVEAAEQLAQSPELLDGELGWDLLLCIDPDGHVRNESWFGETVDVEAYYRGFFRPPMAEYPDWDLPLEHTSALGTLTRPSRLPEAAALRSALDLCRPVVLNALHNAELGGVHFYCDGLSAERASALSEVPGRYGMALESVALDDPTAAALAPGVFPMPDFAPLYDQLLASGHPDPASLAPVGQSAAGWCRQYGTASLVAEVPYWTVDTEITPSESTEAELVSAAAASLEGFGGWLAGFLSRHSMTTSGALARAVLDGPAVASQMTAGLQAWAANPAADRPADSEAAVRYDVFLRVCLPLRYLGMTLSQVLAEGKDAGEVQERFDDGLATLRQLPLRAVPLSTLVDLQLQAGVAVLRGTQAR